MKVHPTFGRVTVNGAPAPGAEVVLYGATQELTGKGTIPPEGVADEDGVFHLQSYEPADGAPAGKFKVSVIWLEEPPANVNFDTYQPKDRLKGRYADPEKSGLTVEVPEGGGELPPLELKI